MWEQRFEGWEERRWRKREKERRKKKEKMAERKVFAFIEDRELIFETTHLALASVKRTSLSNKTKENRTKENLSLHVLLKQIVLWEYCIINKKENNTNGTKK